MSEPPAVYSYGDSTVAGDRLALLATVFAPTTETFVRQAAPAARRSVLDLGCGPGHTTRLLADALGTRHVLGLDLSPSFVDRARHEHPDLRFATHDVTRVPFPDAPADLVFARYVLAHLPDPFAVAARWATQLAPDGRLLLEEIASIDTDVPVLRRYLDHVVAMAAWHATDLLVGGRLPTRLTPDPTDGREVAAEVAVDQTATITPEPATVARLFSMNLSVWRADPYATTHLDPADLDELAAELADLAAGRRDLPVGAIVWTHRQLAFTRR